MPFFIAIPAKRGRNSPFSIWTTGFAAPEQAAIEAVELHGGAPYVLVEADDLRGAVQLLLLPPPPKRRRTPELSRPRRRAGPELADREKPP